MAILDDFKARFPEFDAATADQYVPILEDVWPCYYGGNYEDCGKEIVLNLLAHLITQETSGDSGQLQAVQSQSVGDVSVSYAPGTASGGHRYDHFRATKYGARYLMLTQHRRGALWV